MTTLLFSVGIFVFFLTVGGAVMIGGHLLQEIRVANDPNVTRERVTYGPLESRIVNPAGQPAADGE